LAAAVLDVGWFLQSAMKFFKTKTGIHTAERVQSYSKINAPALSNGKGNDSAIKYFADYTD
jgi:hypothetical protein